MEIVRYLSQNIGVRLSGTATERRAADYVAERMRSLGLSVQIQQFKFIGWRPTKKPTLELLEPLRARFDVSYLMFSESTPDGGVEGKVLDVGAMQMSLTGKGFWPKYAVVDDSGTRSLSSLLVPTADRYRPQSFWDDLMVVLHTYVPEKTVCVSSAES